MVNSEITKEINSILKEIILAQDDIQSTIEVLLYYPHITEDINNLVIRFNDNIVDIVALYRKALYMCCAFYYQERPIKLKKRNIILMYPMIYNCKIKNQLRSNSLG